MDTTEDELVELTPRKLFDVRVYELGPELMRRYGHNISVLVSFLSKGVTRMYVCM